MAQEVGPAVSQAGNNRDLRGRGADGLSLRAFHEGPEAGTTSCTPSRGRIYDRNRSCTAMHRYCVTWGLWEESI